MSYRADSFLPKNQTYETPSGYTLAVLQKENTRCLAYAVRKKAPLFSIEGAEENAREKIQTAFADATTEIFLARRQKYFLYFITSFPCAAAALCTLKNTANNPVGNILLGGIAFALLGLGMKAAGKLDKMGRAPSTARELNLVNDKEIFYLSQNKINALKAPVPR